MGRTDFTQLDKIRELVEQAGGSETLAFDSIEDWRSRYEPVRKLAVAAGVTEVVFENRRLSLDEIGWLLLHGARSQPRPPRLAVVLSGGGAKCSYQVGVIRALEEKLAAIRKLPNLSEQHLANLDIGLVVGTSGPKGVRVTLEAR